MGKAPKYVSAAYLAERTSLSKRWFTGQACEGKIPGAVQPIGPGGGCMAVRRRSVLAVVAVQRAPAVVSVYRAEGTRCR